MGLQQVLCYRVGIVVLPWLLIALGCRTVDVPFPELDAAATREVVAVGYFARGVYLPEDEACGTVEADGAGVVCLDPPPMRLRFVSSEVLYGEELPDALYAFTASHYGMDQVEFGSGYPYILLMETDGQSYVVPRYQYRGLAHDEHGQFAVPDWPGGWLPGWLPCDLDQAAVPFQFKGPRARIRIELEGCPRDPLCKPDPRVEVRAGYAWSRHGVPLEAIRQSLAAIRVPKLHFRCGRGR